MSAQHWYQVEHHAHGKGDWKRHPRRHASKIQATAWAQGQRLVTREEALKGARGGVYRIVPADEEQPADS